MKWSGYQTLQTVMADNGRGSFGYDMGRSCYQTLYRLYCLTVGGIFFGYDMGRSGYQILYRLYCLTMGGILFGYDMGRFGYQTLHTVMSGNGGGGSFWLWHE